MASPPIASAASVNEAVVAAYASNLADCSGFLRDVGLRLGYVLSGNADTLIDTFRRSWRELDSIALVLQEVRAGRFVVAGLKSDDHTPKRQHGHVVVIVDGPLYRGKYPRCWCGSIGAAQSKGTKSIGEVWSASDRDNVCYFEPR
jgi:hypothetical protein